MSYKLQALTHWHASNAVLKAKLYNKQHIHARQCVAKRHVYVALAWSVDSSIVVH